MNVTKVANALDKAIAEVAEDEYRRLSAGMSPEDIAAEVASALKSFAQLQSGTPPEYSEWDALLYLTWYQPRQINLALAAVAGYREAPRPVHIIDVGCGALATTIAMAISAATANVSPPNIDIEVCGIDPSGHMTSIGRRFLRKLSRIVRTKPFRIACDRVAENVGIYRTLDDYYESDRAKRGRRPRASYWLTVIHAVYATNVDSLQEDLRRIRRKSIPDYEVVTCHIVGMEVARRICRDDATDLVLQREDFHFHGHLNKTTTWRQELAQRLPSVDPILGPYLRGQVVWNPDQDDRMFVWSPQRGRTR